MISEHLFNEIFVVEGKYKIYSVNCIPLIWLALSYRKSSNYRPPSNKRPSNRPKFKISAPTRMRTAYIVVDAQMMYQKSDHIRP